MFLGVSPGEIMSTKKYFLVGTQNARQREHPGLDAGGANA
jgi:hypothetical protein